MTATHPVWFISVAGSSARIGMTPCPGTQEESFDDALSTLKSAGISAVLTLMGNQELQKNEVERLGSATKVHGMKWFQLPIRDDQAPEEEFQRAWEIAAPDVHQLLDEGESIAIHCKGGSGRTGLIAIQILLERGVELGEASALVKNQRPKALTPQPHREYIAAVAQSLGLAADF
ncbi:phosphatase domain-containing putative toxin [Spongorhabdus nitratireducens]